MDIPPVLVLGATGRIGTILRKCWGRDRALWQTRAKAGLSDPEAGPDPGPDWVTLAPLEQPGALVRAASGVKVIICLAGVVPGRSGPVGNLSDNTALAEAAIRAGATVGARVLLASSAAVYGYRAGVLDEATPLAPRSNYGRAKAAMEIRAAALGGRLGVPVCALRIGNIAGIGAILGGWKPGFQLDRFDDGRTPRRSYIGMATLARVLGDLVARPDLPDVLNIASPGAVEMGALLEAAKLGWTPRPAPDSAVPEVVLSTRALARFVTLPETTRADALVAEWHALKETRP